MKNAVAHGEAGHRDDSPEWDALEITRAPAPRRKRRQLAGVCLLSGGRAEGRCKWTFLSSGGQLLRLSAASPREGRLSIKGEVHSAPGVRSHASVASLLSHSELHTGP